MQPSLGSPWKLLSSCHRQRHGEVSKWPNPFWERCLDIAPWMKISGRKGRGWDVCRWVGWGIRTSSISGGLGFNDFVYKWNEISLINGRLPFVVSLFHSTYRGVSLHLQLGFLGPSCINCCSMRFSGTRQEL